MLERCVFVDDCLLIICGDFKHIVFCTYRLDIVNNNIIIIIIIKMDLYSIFRSEYTEALEFF